MNESISENPFLFACGVPRSGTTLLQRMLNYHPEMAIANDSHDVPRALELPNNDLVEDEYREIHYEQLVSQPDVKMRQVCELLELPYRKQMVEFHQGKSKNRDSLSAKSAWLAPQAGLRNWRTDLQAEQIELFEALAADALESNGFELGADKYSNETMDQAHECQTWWRENFLPKHRPVVKHKPKAKRDPQDASDPLAEGVKNAAL